jgi:hypothetical protein
LPVQHYTFNIQNIKKVPIHQPSPSESQHTGIIGPLKTGTNYLQKHQGLSLVNLRFLETELGKQL